MKAMPASVYCGGRMRGVKDFNFPAFDACAEYLRSKGYDVASPAEHDREAGFDETLNTLEGFDISSAIAWDLEQVRTRDAIVLLPGWSQSQGANLERDLALFLGKPVFYYDPDARFIRLRDEPLAGDCERPEKQEAPEAPWLINPWPYVREPNEVRSVSATGGEKGTKLARFDLIPAGPLTQLAEHYGRGAEKYEDRNWERGYEWSKTFAALQRHAWAAWGGEDIDPGTGSPHMVAVAWHALAWLEFMSTHPEFDDRPSR